MAGAMKASLTLELIDKISAPAKAAASALKGIGTEAKKSAEQSVATNVDQLKKAGEAASEKARKSGEVAKEAAKKAVDDTAKVVKKAETAATAPAAEAKAKAGGGLKDWFAKKGDAPVKAAAADDGKPSAKIDAAPRAKGKPSALADLSAGASMAAHLAGDLVGKATAQAKKHVATSVADRVSQELGSIAGDFIAKRSNALMEPVRAQLNSVKENFPILAPLVDKVGGKIEHVAGLASGAAQSLATKGVSAIAGKAGMMAASLVGLPGLAIGAGLLALTQWSKIKAGAGAIFNGLPEPAQKAMVKIGQTLAKTPLAGAAQAFDRFGNYVEGVWNTMTGSGENKMQKLREQLVDQPKQWMQGTWDGLKQQAAGFFDGFRIAPKAASLHALDSLGNMLKTIPSALGNIGVDLAESLTGMDLSGVRAKVNEVVEAFFGIPNKLATLGGEICQKISGGDWTGAATTLATGFVNILLGIPTSLGSLANELVAVFTGVNLGAKAQEIANEFVSWLTSIPGRLTEIGGQIKSALTVDLTAVGKGIMMTLQSGLEAGFAAIKSWASSAAASLKNVFTGTAGMSGLPAAPAGGGGKASPPGRAHGGPVKAGGLYKVGEHGEELFVPGSDGSIIPASDTRRILSPAFLPPSTPYASLAGDGNGIGGGRLALDLRAGAPTPTQSPVNQTFHVAIHAAASEDPETTARRFWAEAQRQARGGLYDGGAA